MQSMAYDVRLMRRWARMEPEADGYGQVLATFKRGSRPLRLHFTPMSRSVRQEDTGIKVGDTRYRVTCPREYGFQPGDRLGPSNAQDPTMEVVTVQDYATHIRMEVRPL